MSSASLDLKLEGVRGRVTANFELAPITWFRVGGAAEALFQPADTEDLALFLERLPAEVPVTVIGVGSNLLVRDGGIPGVVIRLSAKGFGSMERLDGDRIRVGAALPDKRVAAFAHEQSLAGFAFYHGIPGGIGGALRMNAGAYGGETKDALVSAEVLFRDGTVKQMTPEEMGLSYRHNDLPKDVIFIGCQLKGRAGEKSEIEAKMDEIKSKRAESQPIRTKTGGSTFANPDGHRAWQLVDQAGCRGFKVGGAEISNLHCNFMINTGGATAADIERLGEEVRKRVAENSGVMLRWEIKRIGIPLEKDHDILEFMKREASQ